MRGPARGSKLRTMQRAPWFVLPLVLVGCLEPEPAARPSARMVGTGNCGDDPSLADHGISVHAVYGAPGQTPGHRGWNHARVELRNTSASPHHLHATGAVVYEVGPRDRCGYAPWAFDRTLAPGEAVAFDVEMRVDDAPPGRVFTISLPMRVDEDEQTTCTDVAGFVAVGSRR